MFNGEYTKHCTQNTCTCRYQLRMATPAEVSKNHYNFRIRQFKEKCHFYIAANLTLNMMVSFIILLIACTARIACANRHTDGKTHRQTDRHTHKTTTVTLAVHARQGLIIINQQMNMQRNNNTEKHYYFSACSLVDLLLLLLLLLFILPILML